MVEPGIECFHSRCSGLTSAEPGFDEVYELVLHYKDILILVVITTYFPQEFITYDFMAQDCIFSKVYLLTLSTLLALCIHVFKIPIEEGPKEV